ncbi:hypothetical protein [Turicibacter bilis]|uniref:Uncharacterized protein n=1 Tax=Turicibacter bilis TaxID=2735723 RepID=A0ABY5JNY3_9FIRM|nr:hypothetical protein [Turicibacter bilis]MBS3199861.1 hypothetical protein [Turicibacter bilis]UUF06728.1 hypothetical protein J0J69_03880 [Turicibacter bilis]
MNVIKIGIFTFLISIVIFVYTVVIDQGFFPSFFYIDGTNRDIESLVNTIWGIQVTISLVSITLVSIIVGKMDRKLYGLKISDLLAIHKKSYFKLTYFECIGLVVILAGINIFSVIHVSLPATMLFFIINLILLGYILLKTYDVLTKEEQYIQMSGEYLQSELMLKVENKPSRFIELLKNLLEETQLAIYTNNILVIQENLECLFLFLKRISNIENNESVLKEILSVYEELMKQLLKSRFQGLYIQTLKSFLSLERCTQTLIAHFIDMQIDNLSEFCHESLNESEYKEIMNFLLIDLIKEDSVSEIIPSKEMSYYLVRAYYGRYRNILHSAQEDEVLNDFIRHIMIHEIDRRDDYLTDVRYSTVLRLSKLLFDCNDVGSFTKVLQELYKSNSFSISHGEFENLKVYLILMQLNIYCYYAIAKEDYFTDATKNKIEQFLLVMDDDGTKEVFSLSAFIPIIDYKCWRQYEILEKSLTSWEYMPYGKAKWMCMESAISEFYFLYTICFVRSYELEKIYDLLKNKKLLLDMLEFYNKDGELKPSMEKQLQTFKKIYLKDKARGRDNAKDFYQFLSDKKVLQEILQEKSYSANPKMCMYRNKLISAFNKLLSDNSAIYKINDDMESSITSFQSAFLILNSVLTEQIPLTGTTFEQLMIDKFNRSIINQLKDKLIDYQINYSQIEKVKSLLALFDQQGLKPSLRLNASLLENWFFKSNESDEAIKLFDDFEDSLSSIDDYIHNQYTYYLDMNNEYIGIKIKNVGIRYLTDHEILTEAKKYLVDDVYRVNVANNLYLTFTESQIKEYIQNKFQVFEVEFDVHIPAGIRGIEVKVEYDK